MHQISQRIAVQLAVELPFKNRHILCPLSQKHSQIGSNSVDNEDDETDNPETEDILNDETTTSHNNFERKLSEAQYLLKLKSQHNLTQISISEIIDATKGLIADRLQIVKKKLIF